MPGCGLRAARPKGFCPLAREVVRLAALSAIERGRSASVSASAAAAGAAAAQPSGLLQDCLRCCPACGPALMGGRPLTDCTALGRLRLSRPNGGRVPAGCCELAASRWLSCGLSPVGPPAAGLLPFAWRRAAVLGFRVCSCLAAAFVPPCCSSLLRSRLGAGASCPATPCPVLARVLTRAHVRVRMCLSTSVLRSPSLLPSWVEACSAPPRSSVSTHACLHVPCVWSLCVRVRLM